MKPIETLAEYLRLVLTLDAKSLPCVHTPETLLEHAANLALPSRGGERTLLHL
jgi:hypothetical protein